MEASVGRGTSTTSGDSVALGRGLAILDLVRGMGGASVPQIIERIGLPSSTTYRLVGQLVRAGYLMEVDHRVLPSDKLSEARSVDAARVRHLATPVLVQLRNYTGLTALIAIRVHTVGKCVEIVRGQGAYRMAFQPGQLRALHAGASVLPLLAFAPPQVVEETLNGPSKRPSTARPEPEELRGELRRIRKRGYAFSSGSIGPGMVGVGVPVLDGRHCLGALSLVGEASQFSNLRPLVSELTSGANALAGMINQHGALGVLPVGSDDPARRQPVRFESGIRGRRRVG
ncbi:hypothetical protein GCM10009785_22380 [Brooklawnia cerclae]